VGAIDLNQYERVKLEKRDGILAVSLSNPERRNAMTGDMHAAMEHIWDEIDRDDEVRVVILQGDPAGNAFCSGADVQNLAERRTREPGADAPERTPRHMGSSMSKGARSIFWNMMDCEKPIISKVRGLAYGLGVNVALLADIVIAEEGARFCDSHVKVGITAGDGGVPLWPLLLGFHRAKEYLMTGKPMLAEDAERWGLINHCVKAEQLDAFTWELAEQLRDMPPLALRWTKISVNTMLKQMMAGAFEMSLAYDFLSLKSEDHLEAARAFVEKRPGRYQAK
jgi:enoyl-CoA hydratase